MPRAFIAIAATCLALTTAGAAAASEVPPGLVCPDEAGGAELISTAQASAERGVSGLCVYYVYDEENPDRNVTLTLRIGTSDYDPNQTFKQPKIDLGGMKVEEEATRPMPYGGRMSPATIIALTGKESDLGDITDVYDTLYVFRLEGRVVSLQVEYTNISADLRTTPRDALLAAQQ